MVQEDRDGPGTYASPPCYAHELDPGYFGLPPEADAQAARDVARWRKAERARLYADRRALSVTAHRALSAALAAQVAAALARLAGPLAGRVIAFWWPIRGEPDLRALMADLAGQGARPALPVVVRRAAPLIFRHWAPGCPMERGAWDIPVPAAEMAEAVPEVVVAPLLGWDAAGYRLGNGGGYYDRTLAAMTPRPLVIGAGADSARLASIYPQPHDIPMDAIVTEAGLRLERRT